MVYSAIIAHRRVIESELLLKLEAVTDKLSIGGVDGAGDILDGLNAVVLVKINLSRRLGECLQCAPSLRKVGYGRMLPIRLRIGQRTVWRGSRIRNAVQLKTRSHAIRLGNGRAFLRDMRRQAIDPALGEEFAALLAGVRISIAIVVEFSSADEILQDEGIGLAAHCASQGLAASTWPATSFLKAVSKLMPPEIQYRKSDRGEARR